MSAIFVWRDRLQNTYAGYAKYIDKTVQFILALAAFMMINNYFGLFEPITKPIVAVALAVIFTFLPMAAVVLAIAFLIVIHMCTVSMGVAGVSAAIFLLMFIFYVRFSPKTAIVILLMILSTILKIPYAIPIIFGLIGAPAYVIPIVCGTISYFMVEFVKNSVATIKGADGLVGQVTVFLQQVFRNKEMWIIIAASVICLFVVSALRKMSCNHAWEIAIVSGAVVNVVTLTAGYIALNVKAPYAEMIVGNIIAVFIGLAVELFVFTVDYSRTENLQFEDDEYYYYVKAVPKISISAPNKTVKKINVRQDVPEESLQEMTSDDVDELLLKRSLEEEVGQVNLED